MTRLLFAFATALLLVPAAGAQTYVSEVKAEADYIKDGDTPLIEIRMFGLDTPEKDQLCERSDGTCYRCGRVATFALMDMILREEATYKFTGDVTFGRPVASVFLDGKDVSLEMVRRGLGVAYLGFLPNHMKPDYRQAEKEARDAGRGIWQGRFIDPYDWRNGKRLPCEQ